MAVTRYEFSEGRIDVHEAWRPEEVRASVRAILGDWSHVLPGARDARILIKPNLNNDLNALTGNSADLRVLEAVVRDLRERGYTDITIADGSNVGVHRRGIDSQRRLRVDRLAQRHGASRIDLNRAPTVKVKLKKGTAELARPVLEADFLLSIPKVKTHAEAGLSLSMKNWVGTASGQQKRQIHLDLNRNIAALNETIRPHLILMDALVGMEGNGPGDGTPFRMGRLVVSNNTWLHDIFVCRLVDYPWDKLRYLRYALEDGRFRPGLPSEVAAKVPVSRRIQPAPPRSPLAVLSEKKVFQPLKLAVRPLVDRPEVAQLAYRARIVQDVYVREDDGVTGFVRDPARCGDCRKCEEFCPDALKVEAIGTTERGQGCLSCLYCYWACPGGAITLQGPLGFLAPQIEKYKARIEAL